MVEPPGDYDKDWDFDDDFEDAVKVSKENHADLEIFGRKNSDENAKREDSQEQKAAEG